MLFRLALDVLEVDGSLSQASDDCLDVCDLLLLLIGPRRHAAHALVKDFVDLTYGLDSTLLGNFLVSCLRLVIRDRQKVSATTHSILLVILEQRIECIRQALDLLLDLVYSFDDSHQIQLVFPLTSIRSVL